MVAAALSVGMLLEDKYRILELLGSGGMSNVWLARDERLGKLWAIKEIKPNEQGVRGELIRQALIDEAQVMKRLDHPSIPRIVDIHDMGTTVYVVMDYVEGRSLSSVMRARKAPFPQRDVIAWGIALCDALGYLHELDPPIVYRDVKPANVIVREDGSIRLIDFGIAAPCENGRVREGHGVGTPGYAPPEQLSVAGMDAHGTSPEQLAVADLYARGTSPAHDARTSWEATPISDVYALGATLYSLVTGHVPLRVHDNGQATHVEFRMRPIRAWDPKLSEGFERIIERATQQDPSLRYQDMRQMRYDLEHYERLTAEWRSAQEAKLAGARRLALAATLCLALGILALAGAASLRSNSLLEIMRRAQAAPTDGANDAESEAERLYTQALAVDPGNVDALRGLIATYEADYSFSDAEERRWRRAYDAARGVDEDESFARLCYDVGICYLSYFGVDYAGGSVGNAAIQSIDAASPWFERAILLSEANKGGGLDAKELEAAQTYRVIAGFHARVSRSGREGRADDEAYRRFWHEYTQAIQLDAAAGSSQAEGVRLRLYQVGVEAVSSPTYVAGFARSGIAQEDVRLLCQTLRQRVAELSAFALADEYAQVYGPMYAQMTAGLEVAERSVTNAYENPVARMAQEETHA